MSCRLQQRTRNLSYLVGCEIVEVKAKGDITLCAKLVAHYQTLHNCTDRNYMKFQVLGSDAKDDWGVVDLHAGNASFARPTSHSKAWIR